MEVLGLDHVDLTVSDLERAKAFYGTVFEALGFRRVPHVEYVAWANAKLAIGLRTASDAERKTPFDRFRPGLHHLAFRALSRADVDAFHAFLVQHEIPVLDPPAEYPEYGEDYYAVFFADPDGMKLELVHFPWGFWRKAQLEGEDPRPRCAAS